jgi:alkylation response protein AidB-like acyl-CoA dehydrogenase
VAQNYFSDFPERQKQLKEYSDVLKLAMPFEEAWGEKGFYKDADEAMETYMAALSELGKFAATEVRPFAEQVDREGAKLKDGEVILPAKLEENLKKAAELGFFSLSQRRANGGLNMPHAIEVMALEMFGHADPNFGLNVANNTIGNFIELVGTSEQVAKYLPKMQTIEWKQSMALTEPQAGSDLGKLRTSARKEGDHYLVTGNKIFISGGHGQLCFALVRTDPNSKGLDGLSVVLVPRKLEGSDKNNFKVAKIEDKVCLHASPTCELIFEDSVGYLIGEEGNGFKVMLEMMNGARLEMAALATGIAASALEEAKKYAQTRVTMGKPIIRHPMVADMIYEMELEIRAMRALCIEAACAHDWMRLAEQKGDKAEIKRWKTRYRRLTPLAKYFCCERAITIARNAVQIFGGYGVCRDYPVERLLRETIIYPIYEGTSQIQSLMVLKDTLKDVASQATGFLGSLAGAWAESMVTRDPVKTRLLQARNELNQGIRTILMSIIKDKFKSDIQSLKEKNIQEFLKDFSLQLISTKANLSFPFLWAERFTRITSDYYALKCMADHHPEGDADHERWILEFANLAIPRMQLENNYMVNRQPTTMEYMKQFEHLE